MDALGAARDESHAARFANALNDGNPTVRYGSVKVESTSGFAPIEDVRPDIERRFAQQVADAAIDLHHSEHDPVAPIENCDELPCRLATSLRWLLASSFNREGELTGIARDLVDEMREGPYDAAGLAERDREIDLIVGPRFVLDSNATPIFDDSALLRGEPELGRAAMEELRNELASQLDVDGNRVIRLPRPE